MKNYPSLEQQIAELLEQVEYSASIDAEFDTRKVLYDLASMLEWGKTEYQLFDFLSKRFNISKKLYTSYFSNGLKTKNAEIVNDAYLKLFTAILLKVILMNSTEFPIGIRLKLFNTLFKSQDLTTPEWLFPESELGKIMESAWQSTIHNIDATPRDRKITAPPNAVKDSSARHKIPITILFYEGPIARAYLATIHSLGFKPEKIIQLVAAKDIVTKKVVGRWLPKKIRTHYAAIIHRERISYYPKQLAKTNSDFVKSMLNEVRQKFGFEEVTIDNANALLPLTSYSDCVESILIKELTDIELKDYLKEELAGGILYTGGGIMPKKLLDLEHLNFLHIHPGFLPELRGADCALWSILLAGNPSATCFYLSPEIDTGDIIQPYWLPKLSFDIDMTELDLKSIYRSFYSFVDPWVRAFVLRDLIIKNKNLDKLNSSPQLEEDGTTFHFMHPLLQHSIFSKLFGFGLNHDR